MTRLIVDHLFQVLELLRLDASCLLVVAASRSTIAITTLRFELADFLCAPSLDMVELLGQLGLLLVVGQFLVRSRHVGLQSLLTHFLIVDELFCKVAPLEAAQVAQVPTIVMEGIFAFLATHELIVESERCHFSILFPVKLNPALNVPHQLCCFASGASSRHCLVLLL